MSKNNKNIVWLASYPKSGNTWFRVFLNNLFSDSDRPVSINNLSSIPIASSRRIFDSWIGTNSSDLTIDEINNLRPEVYRDLAANSDTTLYLKVHDAWHLNSKKKALFPENITKGVIYLVRNPYDVAASYAAHNGITLKKSINNLKNNDFEISGTTNKLHAQLCQKLFSWSEHISSWIERSHLPVHIIRYEDLLNNSLVTFSNALQYLGLNTPKEQIQKAIKFSQFSELQKQEKKIGFNERPIHAESFFREGKNTPIESLINNSHYLLLVREHQKMMERFGYFTKLYD